MIGVVLLDSGPLGMVTHRGGIEEVDACQRWLADLLAKRVRVVVPEIADYEIRRELLRARKDQGIARLDGLERVLEYLPLTTAVMRHAAKLWAKVRQEGRPTADSQALDGDVILSAQALSMGLSVDEVVVATTNVGHLSSLVTAALWQDIHTAGIDPRNGSATIAVAGKA